MVIVVPALGGCGVSLSDYSLKDQEWFSRPKIFNRSLSIEAPPLSSAAPISQADLISADGACAGVSLSGGNALAEGQPAPTGSVALGHAECDVARAAGKPDNVNLSTGEQGERIAILTYTHGPRPGIYRFVAGRLTDVQSVSEAPATPTKTSKKQ